VTGSRNFTGTDYARGTPPITAPPMTFASWVNYTAATGAYGTLGIFASTNTDHFRTNCSASLGGRMNCGIGGASGQPTANTANQLTINTWGHVASVFASTSSQKVILNGDLANAGSTPATAAGTQATLNRLTMGVRDNLTQSQFMTGLIGASAIWNVALTDDEVVALARGWSPRSIRSTALVWCTQFPGLRSNVPDVIGGLNLTCTGTTSSADGPPMAIW
jgi:hypothetical protein